jgi:hypothetical protein
MTNSPEKKRKSSSGNEAYRSTRARVRQDDLEEAPSGISSEANTLSPEMKSDQSQPATTVLSSG